MNALYSSSLLGLLAGRWTAGFAFNFGSIAPSFGFALPGAPCRLIRNEDGINLFSSAALSLTCGAALIVDSAAVFFGGGGGGGGLQDPRQLCSGQGRLHVHCRGLPG